VKPFKESENYLGDLQAAYDYYKAYGRATADRFFEAHQEAFEIILRHPFVCRPRRHGWRQMLIRRYPNYSIFYKEFSEFWLLAGVVSTVNDPDWIQTRLLVREVKDRPEPDA
jgi:hypothetical protein